MRRQSCRAPYLPSLHLFPSSLDALAQLTIGDTVLLKKKKKFAGSFWKALTVQNTKQNVSRLLVASVKTDRYSTLRVR